VTGERAHAYGNLMRILRRLESVGGLVPDEADQIRSGADALLFAGEGVEAPELGAVGEALSLIEGLVAVGRWPGRTARRTLDALAACGPAQHPAARLPIGGRRRARFDLDPRAAGGQAA
jgi:hypothetical protein